MRGVSIVDISVGSTPSATRPIHGAEPVAGVTARGCFPVPWERQGQGQPRQLASLSDARVVRASEQKGLAKLTSESEWDESAILDGADSPRLQGGCGKQGSNAACRAPAHP